jgi:hypothetical protein
MSAISDVRASNIPQFIKDVLPLNAANKLRARIPYSNGNTMETAPPMPAGVPVCFH